MTARTKFFKKFIFLCAVVVLLYSINCGKVSKNYVTKLPLTFIGRTLVEADPTVANTDEMVNSKSSKNLLDGCYHVYLDVGSNVGIQVRKLFEPELYPGSEVLGIYNSSFGKPDERRRVNSEHSRTEDTKTLCAVGFEPNSHQTRKLKLLEDSYNKCGWFVKFFTESAVSDHEGQGEFFTDNRKWELGGGVLPPDVIATSKNDRNQSSNYKKVKMIRLSSFLRDVVATRKIGPVNINKPPEVVMKMDIEGSEVDVIADLVLSGSIKYINLLMVEWHRRSLLLKERQLASDQLDNLLRKLSEFCNTHRAYTKNRQLCRFTNLHMDDEKYFKSDFDLPKW